MTYLIPSERGSQMTLLIRSRSLRRRAMEAMERAEALRERSGRLLRTAGGDPPADPRDAGHPPHPDADDAEALQWYRAQVREMLSAGWSDQELADVGITDALLRELGLHGME
jgi:hypothetical protein